MKVKEALKLFNITVCQKRYWDWRQQKYITDENGDLQVYTPGYADSLSSDRKVLESNFESEVLIIDHVGFVGVLGFKMRNNRMAMFIFNSPSSRVIERVCSQKPITQFNKFKESVKENSNIVSEEFNVWLSLAAITGKFK